MTKVIDELERLPELLAKVPAKTWHVGRNGDEHVVDMGAPPDAPYAVVHSDGPREEVEAIAAIIALAPAIASQLIAMKGALEAADNALRNHACHGGDKAPCLRARYQCQVECGKEAGDALLLVESALLNTSRGIGS